MNERILSVSRATHGFEGRLLPDVEVPGPDFLDTTGSPTGYTVPNQWRGQLAITPDDSGRLMLPGIELVPSGLDLILLRGTRRLKLGNDDHANPNALEPCLILRQLHYVQA